MSLWYETLMALAIPVVWSERQLLHEPGGEVWVGVHGPGTERPERLASIIETLTEAGADVVESRPHSDEALSAVHDPALLDYLERAWRDWEAAGLTENPGQPRVVPYLFPHPEVVKGVKATRPAAASAEAGYFVYDTMTLIGPGTWQAVRAAADAALTAAELVANGAAAAYAACRPPGHHATRGACGGSCYLNNAAIAAVSLRERVGGPVAVLDIDAHHGNGTQAIYYEDPGVLTGSVHVDPGAGWFPHLLGFEGEIGAGDGQGANLNRTLKPGADDSAWLDAVSQLADWARSHRPKALVVALGVDAAAADPESPLQVTPEAFGAAGRTLGALELPTVVVQEGGYDLSTLGPLVLETLRGFESGCGLIRTPRGLPSR